MQTFNHNNCDINQSKQGFRKLKSDSYYLSNNTYNIIPNNIIYVDTSSGQFSLYLNELNITSGDVIVIIDIGNNLDKEPIRLLNFKRIHNEEVQDFFLNTPSSIYRFYFVSNEFGWVYEHNLVNKIMTMLPPPSEYIDWIKIINKPNTVLGYNITDVYTKTECDNLFLLKTNNVNWIDIVNKPELYTKTEINNIFEDINNGSGTPITWNSILDKPDIYLKSDTINISWTNITNKPLTITNYGITDVYTKSEIESMLVEISAGNAPSSWSSIIGKPTTIQGFGITDVYTKTECNDIYSLVTHTHTNISWNSITDKPSNVNGYGILDVYTKSQIDSLIGNLDSGGATVYWNTILNKPTTVSGFGITDAVTISTLSNYSQINHTHSGYAASFHTHTEYANSSHSHNDYALTTHTHSGYSSSTHTHTDYSPLSHIHSNYAPTTHSHTDYASLTHSHSNYIPLISLGSAVLNNETAGRISLKDTGTSYSVARFVSNASGIECFGNGYLGSFSYGIQAYSNYSGDPGHYAMGVFGSANTKNGHGVGVWGVGGLYGVVGTTVNTYGLYTYKATYSTQGYAPFTGQHTVFVDKNLDLVVGDLVEIDSILSTSVNQTYFYIKNYSTSNNSVKVIGVLSNSVLDHTSFFTTNDDFYNIHTAEFDENDLETPIHKESSPKDEMISIMDNIKTNYIITSVNAVGEGMINVCEANGNIDIGDYLVSTDLVPGKAQKQNDDLLHNYTVAKSCENVNWEDTSDLNIFEVNGIKCKSIGCSYHCG